MGLGVKNLPSGWQKTWAAKDGGRKGKRSMPGSEKTAAAKEVDAVFSTAAVAETRGGGGEGGGRRQRATGVGDNKVDGRLGGSNGGSVRMRRRDQWRETVTSRPWRQQRTALKEKEAADDAGEMEEKRPSGNRERRHRWLGLCGVEKEKEEKEEAEVDGCDGQLGRRDRRVDEDRDEADGNGEV